MADAQTIARANVKLIPKFDNLEKSISQQIDGANLGGAGKGVGSKIGANLAEGIKSAAKGLNLGDAFDSLSPALGGIKDAAGGVIDVLGGIGTAAAAGTAAAGAAFAGLAVNIGKQAFDAFASYEQLEGGVETLFKSSSDIVMQNAQDAFKTAGMSANEYMETVTGFSASLLQSLGGDTEAAAKVADRAIIDMSDNANKMGTSIESIQNAYQGFAKQNYTMLDNLKLGYGGTKKEMQRLIEDASKLTEAQEKLGVSVSADNMDFGNIINAISVIQESMGVAGTTSKEAATTIEGSVSSAKAAWENWITELGKDDADMETRTQELVESVAAAARNIVPRVIQIGGEVLEQLPQIIAQAKDVLKAEVLPALDEVTGGAASKIFDALERIGGKVADTAGRLWDKLKPVLDKLMPILEKLGEAVLPVIEGAIDAVGWALDGLIGIFDWVIDRISDLLGWFEDLGKAISGAGDALTGQFTNNSSVPSTRPFALGGTVTSPTTALIGEAGYAETVIPNTEWGIAPLARALSRSMGSGSAAPVVNVSIARVENNRDQDIYDLAHQIGSLTTLSLKTQGFGEPL